jgi:hypothetical protein
MLKKTAQQGFYQDNYGYFTAVKTEAGYVLTERLGLNDREIGVFKTLKECNEIARYGTSHLVGA